MCSEIQFVNFVIEILNRGTFPLTEHGGVASETVATSLQRGVAGARRWRGQGERVSATIVFGGFFLEGSYLRTISIQSALFQNVKVPYH